MHKRLAGREIVSEDSRMEVEYHLTDGWEVHADNQGGGIFYYQDGQNADGLTLWCGLHYRENDPFSQRVAFGSFFDEHRLVESDLLERTVAFQDSSRGGFTQARACSMSEGKVIAMVTDFSSGDTEEHVFTSIATALKELNVQPESIRPITRRG